MDHLMSVKTCFILIIMALLALKFILSIESNGEAEEEVAYEEDHGYNYLQRYGTVIQSQAMDVRR